MSSRLDILRRNLEELEKRAAMYGPGSAPLFVLNQIDDLRAQIGAAGGTDQPEPAPTRAGGQSSGSGEEVASPTAAAPLTVQLIEPRRGQPQVQAQHPVLGEAGPVPLRLPYTVADLELIQRALTRPPGKISSQVFDAGQISRLQKLGLAEGEFLLARMTEVVGRALFAALFPDPVSRLFHAACLTRSRAQALPVCLLFDAGAVNLAEFPWELLHDDVPLVADGIVDLIRYIAHPHPRPVPGVQLPLQVLGISPRPSNLAALPPLADASAVAGGLQSLVRQGALAITWLSSGQHQALADHLRQHAVDIVHFDGHGTFAQRCPGCAILYYPARSRCDRCGYPLHTVEPQGYLAFADAAGNADLVSARVWANTLARSRVQLVVLSACMSGEVGGGQVFNGTGPALIQAGVPAVVAMQLSVANSAAVAFASVFYDALAAGHTLPAAAGWARQRLYQERRSAAAWFIPALYLRSSDPSGQFVPAHG